MCLRFAGIQWLYMMRKFSHTISGKISHGPLFGHAYYHTIGQKVSTNSYESLTCFSLHRKFSKTSVKLKKAKISVTYVKANGEKFTVQGKEGDNLLDIAVNNNVDLDGFGACEGTLSCSTCHLIFKQSDYDSLEEEPMDEELDMLDLAFGRTPTSRLGCQVCVTKKQDGLEVNVPAGVLDARES